MDEKLKQRIIHILNWTIKHFDFMKEQMDLNNEDSPELKEAKELLAELKNENI